MNTNLEEPKLPTKETPEQKKLRETKERIAETKKFKALCIDYHKRNSADWNMKSYEKDAKLYEEFLKIDIKKLPTALKPVYLHRLAYVQAIAQLGKNKRLKAFALKNMGLTESDLGGKFDLLFNKVKGSTEYKALTRADYEDAKKALKGSITLLSRIPSGGAWKVEAAKILKPDRVDDEVAHQRLLKAFKLIYSNVSQLQRKSVTS